MAVPQITIRLPASSKKAFEEYAVGIGLTASELFKLLIVRERKQRRLEKLSSEGKLSPRTRRPAGVTGRLPTITAHLSSIREVKEFDAYAQECGLNRTGAGAELLETELKERWLEHALCEPY